MKSHSPAWQTRLPVRTALFRLYGALLCLLLAACSTWQPPPIADSADLRARAVTEEIRGVRLSAAVLANEDSRRIFGVDVNATDVQPVWIEVENTTPNALWLLRSGTDPDYFSPLEVAWSFHAAFSSAANARLDDHFHKLSFPNPIPPETTVSGFLFTNPHRQTKLLNVDILGEGQIFAYTLFPAVPGDAPAEPLATTIKRYSRTGDEDYRETDALRARLEEMTCCATGVDGDEPGDPLNVVLVGELGDVVAALVRRGFRKLEFDVDAAQRLFGRVPDVVARKSGQGGVPANWLRLWVAPFRFRGNPVFLAQAGRPIGGRFAARENGDLRLHPNVDEARDILIQDMLYSGGLGQLAFAHGVGAADVETPRASLGGTRYFTDGLRVTMFFFTRPRAVSNVEILDWVPYSQRHEPGASKPDKNAAD